MQISGLLVTAYRKRVVPDQTRKSVLVMNTAGFLVVEAVVYWPNTKRYPTRYLLDATLSVWNA